MPPRLAAVRKVAYPLESRLHPLYKSAYFIDSFAIRLPPSKTPYKPDTLAQAMFGHRPIWFSFLMWTRDRIMSIFFGVKPSTQIQRDAGSKGMDTISVFPVLHRSEREIILGEKDKHLDFQTSTLIRGLDGEAGGKEMISTTVVHCHGLLGRMYINVIKPFHVLIVKYSLARVPSRLTAEKEFSGSEASLGPDREHERHPK